MRPEIRLALWIVVAIFGGYLFITLIGWMQLMAHGGSVPVGKGVFRFMPRWFTSMYADDYAMVIITELAALIPLYLGLRFLGSFEFAPRPPRQRIIPPDDRDDGGDLPSIPYHGS